MKELFYEIISELLAFLLLALRFLKDLKCITDNSENMNAKERSEEEAVRAQAELTDTSRQSSGCTRIIGHAWWQRDTGERRLAHLNGGELKKTTNIKKKKKKKMDVLKGKKSLQSGPQDHLRKTWQTNRCSIKSKKNKVKRDVRCAFNGYEEPKTCESHKSAGASVRPGRQLQRKKGSQVKAFVSMLLLKKKQKNFPDRLNTDPDQCSICALCYSS